MNDLQIVNNDTKVLKKLQARIKNARLYQGENKKITRLYIPYGKQIYGVKSSAWFEIVNDRITPRVKVENIRHENYYDNQLEQKYLEDLHKQFHEIIHDCEMQRMEVPLHQRLKDDITPVYQNSMLHQVQALRFCCTMKVTALFADTGTGKSKVAIDLCMSRYEAGQIKKVIIFCPVSTKKNFRNEIEKWNNNSKIQWKITGIESISSSNKSLFSAMDFIDSETQIIIDESHMVKTPTAKRSKRLKMMCEKTSYKLIMTGTPVTENVHNLYMQYAMLSDEIIGVSDWLKFSEKYLIIGGRSGDEIISYKNIDHLMGLVEPYTYQISKSECMDLPAMKFDELTCGMTEEQMYWYQQEKEKLLELIKEDWVEATDIFRCFTAMQQICSGIYDDDYLETNKPDLIQHLPLHEKIVFFAKYIFEIDLIIKILGQENCARFTGQNPKERDEELYEFAMGNKKYFVATMQSGGTGLNGLQDVCSTVVFYSNSFSYFQRKQSIGRIDRKGQKNEMKVIDLVVDAGIEWKILSALQRKSGLANEISYLLKDKTKLKKYAQEL